MELLAFVIFIVMLAAIFLVLPALIVKLIRDMLPATRAIPWLYLFVIAVVVWWYVFPKLPMGSH